MRYLVVVLPTAERDLDQILTWLFKQSPTGAKKWLERWDETRLALTENPGRCAIAPESTKHPIPIHQIIFRTRKGNPYRALFAIQDQKVFVIHIRGTGQRLIRKINFPINE